ncbi:MAG: AarF/ABC1/UbiB kinase family protein [Acidobacteria bacterium]|nr:MAG: AarF/ABC1/UbiB kinase family protein [Acidobacteriota bacterium]
MMTTSASTKPIPSPRDLEDDVDLVIRTDAPSPATVQKSRWALVARAREAFRGWARSVEIVSLALVFGLYVYLDLLAATDARKIRGRLRKGLHAVAKLLFSQEALHREERLARQAVWLKERLLKLGPTFIKIGQALATRADVLPLAYVKELSKLQDEVPPFPHETAMRLIESELGAPVAALFAHLDDAPVAAASLGQVYYGRLTNGEEVAVKVQRPRLKETIDFDLRILRRIVGFLKRYPNLFRGVDWTGVLNEFATTIYQEMDYLQEARNADRFRHNFRSWKDVYVPRIYWHLTTRRVLTMEYIHGFKVTEVDVLRARGFTPAKINRLLARTYLKQMLQDGFFHADPHPGNLRVMPDGRLAFFDFGMAGHIDGHIQALMIDAFFHILDRDVEGLVEDLMKLEFLDADADRDEIRPLVEDLFKDYLGLKLSEIRFKELTYELADVVYEYHFKIPSRFTYMIRALMELEGIGVAIDPDFNFIDTAKPFARQYLLSREARRFRHRVLGKILRGENHRIDFGKLWYLAKIGARVLLDKLQSEW